MVGSSKEKYTQIEHGKDAYVKDVWMNDHTWIDGGHNKVICAKVGWYKWYGMMNVDPWKFPFENKR